jgi:hypothetical protein
VSDHEPGKAQPDHRVSLDDSFVSPEMARGCTVGLAPVALLTVAVTGQEWLWSATGHWHRAESDGARAALAVLLLVQVGCLAFLLLRAWRTRTGVGTATATLVFVILLNLAIDAAIYGFPAY